VPSEIFIHSGASQVREILKQLHAEQYTDAVLRAYLNGLRYSYYITVACATAAFFVACGLSWKKMERKRAGPNDAAEASPATVEDGNGVREERLPESKES
jgi:hypothetical protein